MNTADIQIFRASLREMVRELGMLSRKSCGTDLSPLQSHILIELNQRPLSVTNLAAILCVEKASISRTLKGMEEDELIVRKADQNDARAFTFSLSAKGKQCLQHIEDNANDFISQALCLASEQETQAFTESIHGLTASLRNARRQREMEIIIRPIEANDNAAMAEIVRDSFRDNKIDHLEGVSLHDPGLEKLAQVYDQPGSAYWVAESQGKILGGIGFAPLAGGKEGYCEMQKLYFNASVKGAGLGRRMIARVLAGARLQGYKFCYLETLPELSAAVRLYEAFGFVHLDGPLGNTGHNSCDICMVKSLD